MKKIDTNNNIFDREEIIRKTAETLVKAGSTFSKDKFAAYDRVIREETGDLSCWADRTIRENAVTAEEDQSPLCDDTGIPHIILEVGKNRCISGQLLEAVQEGIKEGLKTLPGRPMAILGDDTERVSQSGGLNPDSEGVLPAPFMLRYSEEEDRLRLTVLMQGGGPEIRAKTYRVFHKHSMDVVIDEVISWAKEVIGQLGCSPATIAVGIGRSHYEASSMMLQAMAEGNYDKQSVYEKRITDAVNESRVGALGLGGDHSVLGTFIKVGPQRASGVRIVCMRPCCCFEPRKWSVDL